MDSGFRLSLSLGVAVLLGASCASRPADPIEDFSEEVEQICSDYCDQAIACLPAEEAFESYDECEDSCLTLAYIYNDTACGEALRDAFACIASTPTCEAFLDTNNVSAEDYTCKAEKERFSGLTCEDDPVDGGP